MKRLSIFRFFIVPVLFLSTQVIMSSENNDLAGERAFSNSTNFASEILFSASDFGRKTMHIFKSSNYRLTKAVNYQPSTEAASSPMIKVTASSVTVDLNGFTVSRQDTDVNGVTCPNTVGIEIGFSPYDIAQSKFGASATFNPENVTIKNGVLDNFGIGIVIHAGVKNVVLENITITRSALGVVCAGQTGKEVAAVTLKNVTITGDGTDRSAILSWAKSKLEVTDLIDGDMQYGDGNIMPEQQDPIAGGDSDNNVYSGVLLVYTNTANLEHVTCNNLGEENDYEVDTFTFPVYARNSSNLTFKDVTVSGSKSDSMVAGITCDTCSFVTMKNIISTNNSNINTATTMGLYFKGATTNISIDGAQINNNSGNSVIGMYFAGACHKVQLSNIDILGTQAINGQAGAIYFASNDNAGITFKNVVAKNNAVIGIEYEEATVYSENTCAYGIKMNSGNALTFDNVNCSYNTGPNATQDTNISTAGLWNTVSSVGIWLVNPSAVEMKNVTCDYNTLGGTTSAAYTFGILLDNPSDVTMDSVSCSHNVGNAHVSGLFINGGQSVQVLSGQFNDNIMQGTHDADVQTNAVIITPNGNISKHSVLPEASVDAIGWLDESEDDDLFDAPESLKGAFGIFVYGLPQNSTDQFKNLLLRDVTANNNNGFRALGIELLSCKNVEMYEITTIGNQAHGELFLDHTDDELSQHTIAGNSSYYVGRAVTIPARYVSSSLAISPDIFGIDFNPIIDVVDVQKTMQNVLNEITYLKDGFGVDTHSQIYGHYSVFVNSEILLRSIVAKKRAWGNAVGVQIQNSSNVLIDGVNASGNTAQRDSAFGILFANHCTDCSVTNAQCNANTAWIDSGIEYRAGTNVATIDITAMNPFWAAMDVRLPNPDDTGYINSAHENYGTLTTADVNADGRFVVTLYNGSTTKELCTPCGPIAAGIVIGDTSERISIQDSVCAGNNGNAGQAYGILHDVSTNAVVQSSKVFQNLCNTCGIAFGIAEFTPESGSIHFANTAFGNQYENFLNSNYLVPFDPDGDAEFPVKVGFNGDVSPLLNASVFDNIEVRFMNTLSADPTNLPDGVSAYWSAQSMVGFPGGTYDNPLHASMTATSNTTGTANENAVEFDVDYTRGAYENLGSLTVIDPIGGWNVVIDTVVGSANLHVNVASQEVDISGTAHLEREGFESITGITFSGTVYVNVTHLGLVTLDDDHVDEYDIDNSSLLHFEGNEYIEGNVPIDFYTLVYTAGQFDVDNITTRVLTNFVLTESITNSGANETTVPLTSMTSATMSSNLGGVGTVISVSNLTSSNNTFAWDDSEESSIASTGDTCTLGGITVNLASGTIDLATDTIGRITVNNEADAIELHDASDRLVATLDITGASLTASYSGFNTAARTANMTFNYNQDTDSTTIDTPVLGALSSAIFNGYTLTSVSLSCSAGNDIAPSQNEASFTVSGAAVLDEDGGAGSYDVTISGTVYVDTSNFGVPTKGSTASVLTVTDDETGAVIAQITLGTFTFNSQTTRSATIAATSNTQSSTTTQIIFTGMTLPSTIEGWTVNVDFKDTAYTVNTNQSNQLITILAADPTTVTLTKDGQTTITNLTISGMVQVDVNAVGVVTIDSAGFTVTSTNGAGIDFDITSTTMNVTNITARNIPLALTYAQDGDSTRIYNPVFGNFTSTIVGAQLSGVSIAMTTEAGGAANEANVMYGSSNRTASLNNSTAATLNGVSVVLKDVEININTSAVNGQGYAGGVPSQNNDTQFEIRTAVGDHLVATVTITDITFTGNLERVIALNNIINNASVYIDTRDGVPFSTDSIEARVHKIRANSDDDSLIIANAWIINFTSEVRNITGSVTHSSINSKAAYPGWYNYDNNPDECPMALSGTATLTDGSTSVAGKTISGTIYMDGNTEVITGLGATASSVTMTQGAQTLTINFSTSDEVIEDYTVLMSNARVYVSTQNAGGDYFYGRVNEMTGSGGGVLSASGWTVTFTSDLVSKQDDSLETENTNDVYQTLDYPGYYRFYDVSEAGGNNPINAPMRVQGTATITDGDVTYTGVTISGLVYITGQETGITGLGSSASQVFAQTDDHNFALTINQLAFGTSNIDNITADLDFRYQSTIGGASIDFSVTPFSDVSGDFGLGNFSTYNLTLNSSANYVQLTENGADQTVSVGGSFKIGEFTHYISGDITITDTNTVPSKGIGNSILTVYSDVGLTTPVLIITLGDFNFTETLITNTADLNLTYSATDGLNIAFDTDAFTVISGDGNYVDADFTTFALTLAGGATVDVTGYTNIAVAVAGSFNLDGATVYVGGNIYVTDNAGTPEKGAGNTYLSVYRDAGKTDEIARITLGNFNFVEEASVAAVSIDLDFSYDNVVNISFNDPAFNGISGDYVSGDFTGFDLYLDGATSANVSEYVNGEVVISGSFLLEETPVYVSGSIYVTDNFGTPEKGVGNSVLNVYSDPHLTDLILVMTLQDFNFLGLF